MQMKDYVGHEIIYKSGALGQKGLERESTSVCLESADGL